MIQVVWLIQIAADFLRWQKSFLPCQIQQGCCDLYIVEQMTRDKFDCRYSDLTGAQPCQSTEARDG